MRGITILIALLLLAFSGYLYLDVFSPSATEKQSVTDTSRQSTSPAADMAGPVPAAAEAESEDSEVLRQEAEQYISEITEHSDDPVTVENADDFVSRNEPISLFANRQYEKRTIKELQDEVEPDAPLTIVREQEQVEMTTAKELLAESGGNLNEPVKVLQGGEVKESTVGKVLKNYPEPDSPVSVIRKVENLEVTTLRELMNNETVATNEPLNVIREPYRLQSTTVGELLMGEEAASDNSIFYVRNITKDDVQGLWGIVHNGLVKNFASGIAIRRGQEINEYQVEIPPNADERLPDRSSSFLGKMIDRKTHESYVYNYKKGIMGKNPDLLIPGQEVVIIGFTPQELYKIYEHFVNRSESRS